MKILVIEDEVIFADLYRIFLASKGHNVTVALDGQQGIDLYMHNNPYDLVITDYRMPRKDGLQVIKEILCVNRDQEIILATAYNVEKDEMAGDIKTTNVKILRKPFDFEELEKLMEKRYKLSA